MCSGQNRVAGTMLCRVHAVAQKGDPRGPGIYSGVDFHSKMHAGAESLFEDFFRVRYHYRALNGDFGIDSQLYAKSADAVLTNALMVYHAGGDLSKIDGLTVSLNGHETVRSAINSQIASGVSGNPYFVAGRTGAQVLITATVARYSRTGFYGSTGLGSGMFGLATFGRALNMYDSGVRNTVDLISGSISGVH